MSIKYTPPARREPVNQAPLTAAGGSEIDTQIATAKRYPRDVKESLRKAAQLATINEEVAEEMHYSLPRAGKQIEGPSVRLAEVVASTWGNLRIGSRIIAIEEKEVVVEGAAFDLENNVAVSKQVRRRITRKDGTRYDDDMIGVTANAASSIAVRNAIFQIVPKPFWQEVVDATNEVIHQGKKPVAQRRQAALAWFAARGIQPGQVLALLGKKSEAEVGIEEIRELLGIRNAITEGTSSIAEIFGPGSEPAPGVKRSLNLKKPTSGGTEQPAEGGLGGAAPAAAPTPPQPDPFTEPPPRLEETDPAGEIETAKDEVRRLALELGHGDVKKAKALLREVSGGKWDSPHHPDCTEEACLGVREVLRDMWMKKRGQEIALEPGSDG